MLYLYDVWVNWFEGEENGYDVSYFHEWRKTDRIEMLDQVPVLYIDERLYRYIENDMQDLPRKLLETIYKRAYIRKRQERIALDYACIITDGNDMIVVDTIGYQIPLRKSRLIPRQEQLIYDLIKHKKQVNYTMPNKMYEKKYNILSLEPQYIYGLTRKERQLKNILMIALDQLRTTNNIKELRYWLTEWDPQKYSLLHVMNEDQTWKTLFNSVRKGWSSSHEELTKKLIKGQSFLENKWDIEQDYEQSKSSLT